MPQVETRPRVFRLTPPSTPAPAAAPVGSTLLLLSIDYGEYLNFLNELW